MGKTNDRETVASEQVHWGLILAKSLTVARTISNQFQNSKIHKKNLAPVQSDQSKNGPIQDARGSGRIDCRVRNRNNWMVIAEAKREGSDCKRAITDWHIVTATTDKSYKS
ncbi:hypothetical protein BY996DRAFT_6409605 [Phakopsora pachyrhizi]|nr:hypothetical protein BY996DRAFT_6409605 [Phakopsora pachyrhizi]